MREGVVVCPQCLTMFDEDGNLCIEEPRGEVRSYVYTATSGPIDVDVFRYCPDCGHSLPGLVRYCPYCGIMLYKMQGISVQGLTYAAPGGRSVPEADPAPEAPGDENEKSEASPQPQPQPRTRVITHAHKEAVMVASATRMRHRKWGTEPAGIVSRLLGYSTICALLVSLGYIIYNCILIMNG